MLEKRGWGVGIRSIHFATLGVEQRDDAGRREIKALHPFARFVNDAAERKGDWLQMGQETSKHLIGEGGEQTVFSRTLRFD